MMVRMSAKLCRRNKKQILTIVFHKDRDSTPADEETDEVETGGERVEENKAGYTATPVACGWAGAEMRVFPLFNSCGTDQPTDQRTDKGSYRVACPQLKRTSKS